MITINNPGPQIDASRIAEVEAAIGGKLPASYKDFLLKNNGGRPVPDTIDIDRLPGSPTDIQVFFGIGRGIETSNLSWNIKYVSDRLADHRLLPFACDSGGNFFCLSVLGKFSGGIVYCDLTAAEPVKSLRSGTDLRSFFGKNPDIGRRVIRRSPPWAYSPVHPIDAQRTTCNRPNFWIYYWI